MMKINYKSDFDFFLALRSCNGEEIGWPTFDWEATLYTSARSNAVKVGVRDGIPYGCFNDGGRIHVVMDNHGLWTGTLKAEIHVHLPNGIYPDGDRRVVSVDAIGIELVTGSGDCATEAEVEAVLPLIKGDKGDKFTFADFSADDIAVLQRPAVEEAARVAEAEAQRVVAETNRAAAESARQSGESHRESAELQREQSEAVRIAAETGRAAAEQQRISAEEGRTTAFGALRDDIVAATDNATAATDNANTAAQTATEAVDLLNGQPLVIFEEADRGLEAIEPNLVTDALRKTPQTLTAVEQEQVKANLNIDKKELFNDLWLKAVGSFGGINDDGTYWLNGIKDLTYSDAMNTYMAGRPQNDADTAFFYCSKSIRCNLPIIRRTQGWTEAFENNGAIEEINLCEQGAVKETVVSGIYVFYGCSRLRAINGTFELKTMWPFKSNGALTSARFRYTDTKNVLQLSHASNLDYDSISYLLTNSKGVSIQMSAKMYAKLTDEDNADYAQWSALVAIAAANNITITSA